MQIAQQKANEANTLYRERIIKTKQKLRAQLPDLQARFDTMTSRIEQQIIQIEIEREQGIEPIPQINFSDLAKITKEKKNHIRQRGCVIIRDVFEDDRVNTWNAELGNYLEDNQYLKRLAQSGKTDHYFNTLASSKPQIYGVYWSRPQMQARTSHEMAQAHNFLNHLWTFENHDKQNESIFNPEVNFVYADRVRFRQPGDASLGLSPHVDSGSIERWIDPAYQTVYRHVFSGDIGLYDPFDALGRTQTEEIPSPAVCSAFRSFQAWTALTPQGPGDGTLQLLPIADAMAWVLLRALLDDVPENELCGAAACRAMLLSKEYHQLLYRGYGSIPKMQAGDTVWWHPDVYHGVEDIHSGTGYSSVMYIAPVPDCEKNRQYAKRQQLAFEQGYSAPDFAQDNFESDFKNRFMKSELDELGLRAMAYSLD